MPRLPSDLLSERGRGLYIVWALADDLNVTERHDGGSHARAVLNKKRFLTRQRSVRCTASPSSSGFASCLSSTRPRWPPICGTATSRAIAELRLRYARPNVAFVATHEGNPAGCVAVTMLDASTAVILRLYVRPQCRGLGIARALVNAAIGFAREGGFSRIVLDTNKRLAAAYELYRSFGFTECAPFGSVSYACPTFMELRIS